MDIKKAKTDMVLAFLKNVNSLLKYQIASTMSCGNATTTATHG